MMIERRAASRVKVILPALCWNGSRPDFYAVTDDVSSDGIRFKSAVVPDPGEVLTCSIRHAGSLEARVVRSGRQRFAVRVVRADYPLRLVARRLMALAAAQTSVAPAYRAHPRIVPDMTDVLVTTATGSKLAGRLINLSASGAALALDEPLELGTLITIGRTQAKVARCFDNGIGAAFLVPLQDVTVGPQTVL